MLGGILPGVPRAILKLHIDRKAAIDWRTRRNVHIIMRDGEICRIGQIFDIDLRIDIVSQLEKHCRINACVGGELHKIADRRETLCLMIDAEPQPEPVADIISVPE